MNQDMNFVKKIDLTFEAAVCKYDKVNGGKNNNLKKDDAIMSYFLLYPYN